MSGPDRGPAPTPGPRAAGAADRVPVYCQFLVLTAAEARRRAVLRTAGKALQGAGMLALTLGWCAQARAARPPAP